MLNWKAVGSSEVEVSSPSPEKPYYAPQKDSFIKKSKETPSPRDKSPEQHMAMPAKVSGHRTRVEIPAPSTTPATSPSDGDSTHTIGRSGDESDDSLNSFGTNDSLARRAKASRGLLYSTPGRRSA